MALKQTIVFLRNAAPLANYAAAIEALNGLTHKVGQPVVATYNEESEVKLIAAIGKADGTGNTSYELLTTRADFAELLAAVTEAQGKFTEHITTVATEEKLGHVKAGGDIAIAADGTVTVPELADKADLESPEFTGTPTAPTAGVGTKDTQIATTAFVQQEIADKLTAAQAMSFKGTIGTAEGATVAELPAEAVKGDTYIAVAGCPKINGMNMEPGDMIVCLVGGETPEWTAVQTNIDGAVTGPENAISGNVPVFDGVSGRVIKDSGIDPTTLAAKAVKAQAGTGLTGGGTLAEDFTIAHQEAPTTGTEAGGAGDFVSGIKIDDLGHVAEVTKGSLPTPDGKLKVVEADTLGYLDSKFAKATPTADNTLAVEFAVNTSNKVEGTVVIDIIDGGTY